MSICANAKTNWLRLGLLLLLLAPLIAKADNAAIRVKSQSVAIEVEPDGRYVSTTRVDYLLNDEKLAQNWSQQTVEYSKNMQSLEITEAYTLKADGTRINVDPAAIYTQLTPGLRGAPAYKDHRQTVILFPDVESGDHIVYSVVRRQLEPEFPGNFIFNQYFSRLYPFDDVEVAITLPKTMALRTETHEMAYRTEESGDLVTHHWHYAAPDPLIEDVTLMSPYDRDPRLFATTFKDYDAEAKAMAKLMQPKITVTPTIRAKAAEITSGSTDRREQARLIYEWVAKNIRYVALYAGKGGFEPHMPDFILANRYGDCKDHSVLFASLLKAKGIPAELVLINASNAYRLPGVPVSIFDHLITYLPEWRLYADTTMEVAPFGTLHFSEYGKSVLHVVTTNHALRTTPVLPQGIADLTLKTHATLDAQGVIEGETVTAAIGPYSIGLRQTGRDILAGGTQQTASNQLRALGYSNGSGNFAIAAPEDLAPDYRISSHFKAEMPPRTLKGDGFTMPGGLRIFTLAGDGLMGPLWDKKLPTAEPTPCFSGHMVEDLELTPPDHMHIAKLPEDFDLKTAHLAYSAHWSLAGRTVTLRREFSSRVDQPLCTGDIRQEAAQSFPKIRDDYGRQIALAPGD